MQIIKLLYLWGSYQYYKIRNFLILGRINVLKEENSRLRKRLGIDEGKEI